MLKLQSKPLFHINPHIHPTPGRMIPLPLPILKRHIHPQLPGHIHHTQHISPVILTHRWTMVQVVASLVCDICCDVQGLFLADFFVQGFVAEERVLDDVVTSDCAVVMGWEVGAVGVDRGVVAVVCAEYCVGHGETGLELLAGLRVGEHCVVLALVVVSKPSRVVPHRFYHEYRLTCGQVACTCHHVVHSESIVRCFPYCFGLCESFSSHHNVPQSQGPLKPELGFSDTVQSGLMNCQSCFGHSRQCTEHRWEAQSHVGNFVFDFPDKYDFVFVDAGVCVPVEVPHCVEFSTVGS